MKITGAGETLQETYNLQRKCFDEFLLPIIDDENINLEDLYIVCGDFNNARCLGRLNEIFKKIDYAKKAQCNYNLNIIKDAFNARGFIMADIDTKGEPISTHKIFPLDHIFIRNFAIKDCNISKVNALSDHDILWAEVEIEEYKEVYLEDDEYPLNKDKYPYAYKCPRCNRTIINEQNYSVPPMCDECSCLE